MGSAQFFHQNSIIFFTEVFLSFGAIEIYHMYVTPPPPQSTMCGKVLFPDSYEFPFSTSTFLINKCVPVMTEHFH